MKWALRTLVSPAVEVGTVLLEAVGLLLLLTEDALLIIEGVQSKRGLGPTYTSLDALEAIIRQSGVAGWCAAAGAPLLPENAQPVTPNARTPLTSADIVRLYLEYGSPGAELAEPDARRDLSETIGELLEIYREVVARMAAMERFDVAYRKRLFEAGLEALASVRVVAGPLYHALAVRNATDDEFRRLSMPIAMTRVYGDTLALLAVARRARERRRWVSDEDDLAALAEQLDGISHV